VGGGREAGGPNITAAILPKNVEPKQKSKKRRPCDDSGEKGEGRVRKKNFGSHK